ncbi:MAG TPA: flagellinolysin [Telluria sp.]|nr:flagellinolysin [Telluria sp.]
MALTINTNIAASAAQRRGAEAGTALARSIERLSSGMRVNGASDDAAGLAVAQRLTSRIDGLGQVKRNINDATSMLQVADAAMTQVSDDLQRLRTLAVQAGNKTLSATDRDALKQEANQILAGITQIGQQTTFNGEKVFAQDAGSIGGDSKKRAVMDGLRTGWLTSAEELVKKYYGISGDGAAITIDLDGYTDGPWNVLARVTGNVPGPTGQYTNIHLQLDMADFGTANGDDGGLAPTYSDRIVAHEMVHAIMSRATGFVAPSWFKEGVAELIQGADERLASKIAQDGDGGKSLVNSVSGAFTYEGAYVAARYMHDQLKDLGVEGGMKGLMTYMNEHQNANLDTALAAVSGGHWANAAAFVSEFTAGAGTFGANFIATEMNLTNADTGAIGGLDADGGPSRNARDVVPDVSDRPPDDPLAGFAEIWPTQNSSTATRQVHVQVGATAGEVLSLNMAAMNASALGLGDLDLNKASIALLHIDQALDFVAQQKVANGASLNRLDFASRGEMVEEENTTAARARVLDTDYATETVTMTRSQILQQAANAMLAQANSMPNAVLTLLR